MDTGTNVSYKAFPMKPKFSVIDITDLDGRICEDTWLALSEKVHRQLRPLLPSDYEGKMRKIFSDGGRMSVAVCDGQVTGVAVYRIYENTADGLMMYVDDLVTDESRRSMGAGKALLDHLKKVALENGCDHIKLDSGTQRRQAHKFYFREGLTIVAFHFLKALKMEE